MNEELYNAYVSEAFRKEAALAKEELNGKIDKLVEGFKQQLAARCQTFNEAELGNELRQAQAEMLARHAALRQTLDKLEALTAGLDRDALAQALVNQQQAIQDARRNLDGINAMAENIGKTAVNAAVNGAKKLVLGL